jgi:hypothetical protein
MSTVRTLGSRLLLTVARHVSSDSHVRANAVLDSIENDPGSAFWALGSNG